MCETLANNVVSRSERDWRGGFGLNPSLTGWAPAVGMAILVTGSLVWDAQELRRGITPWTTGMGALTLGLCSLGALSAHRPHPTLTVIIGAWWTLAAMLGVAAFMLGMGLGGLVGLDEENAPDALAIMAVAAMAFALVSFAPAHIVLAAGVYRAGRLPRHVAGALVIAALAPPILLIAIALRDSDLPSQTLTASLLVVGVAWITIGRALHTSA